MTPAWRKLGIVAGGGELPIALAEHCAGEGRDFFVARITPFADPPLVAFPGASHALAAIGARIAALKQAGCDAVTFVGRVPRPDMAHFQIDESGRQYEAAIREAARRGDDEVLRAVVLAHAQAGFQIVGAEQAMAELLAPAGVWGAVQPSELDRADMKQAATVAAALGALDIGQGAVVANGLVLAVEAQEGTDAMLRRCGALPEAIRGTPSARRGVLVKRPKPMQDRRVDLPTIGVKTIEGAAAAGLAGVAVEAGGSFAVRRAAIIEAADKAGLFVCGFSRAEVGEP